MNMCHLIQISGTNDNLKQLFFGRGNALEPKIDGSLPTVMGLMLEASIKYLLFG